MSDINLDITLQQLQTVVTVEQNAINFTPEVVDLRLFAGGFATPAGNVGELQYNNNGVMGATPTIVYDQLTDEFTVTTNVMTISNLVATTANVTGNLTVSNISVSNNATINSLSVTGNSNIANMTATGNITANNISATNLTATTGNITTGNITTVNSTNIVTSNVTANGNVTLGAVGNVHITGGNVGEVLGTDGAGNLSWGSVANANYANFAGNVVTSAQPNITSVGNLTSLTVTGNVAFVGGSNISLGTSSNVKITGGTNGYFLQTDGTGNLTWAAAGNITGNGTPGGANTQVQFNDGGTFAGAAGFTFDKTTNVFTTQNVLVTNTTTIQQAQEKVIVNTTGSNGTVNFDLLNSAIVFDTANASANWTINFRGNSTTTLDSIMSSNQSMTCTYINTNGAAPYFITNLQIDGSNATVYWYGNAPIIGSSVDRDVYTFNIIKTAANTFTTFASLGSTE
jgi:hypothetical protein